MRWITDIQHFWGEYTLAIALFGFGLVVCTQLYPNWKLLMRTLPRHERLNMPWQALVTLAGLLARGLEAHSLHTAVRLRIELELLNRPEKQPLKLHYDTDKEYKDAVRKWKAQRKIWSDDVGRRLGAIAAKRDENERTIVIDDCSALLGDDDIERYFDACDAKRFISNVTINSGFVAPLHLLTGVLAYYDEDWKPVVDAYGRSVIRLEDPFVYSQARKMQSFIFDCWLLWGPSIPICTCEEWHGEVALQYGYGDENNSLTLRCSSPEILRTLGAQNDGPRDRLAFRARVSGVLKWGPDLGTAGFCPAQFAISQDERLVLDTTGQADGIRQAGGTEEQVFAQYYSAYLWIAFVMCKVDPETGELEPHHPKHKWRDLIPFFIHANIADPEAYEFHANQLARGAVEAARHLLNDEPELILRFGCAIDETGCGSQAFYVMQTRKISTRMQVFAREAARQKDGAALQRLRFDSTQMFKDGEYSACALPQIVSCYLDDVAEKIEENDEENKVAWRELRFTRQSDLELLRAFYDECFEPEFPDEDERETYEQIESYLRLKEFGWYENNNYHVIVLVDEDDKPIGGSISDYFNKPNAGVIEYIVVKPEYRRKGCGRRLLELTERALNDDADRSQKRPLDWIAAEVDDPFATKRPMHAIDPFEVARIWHKWGYRLLDFQYVQPSLDEDKNSVETLLLTAKTCPEGRFEKARPTPKDDGSSTANEADAGVLPTRHVEDFLREYLRWAMRIDNPDGHGDFETMKSSLVAKTVPLIGLDEYLGDKARLCIKEVASQSDPELERAVEVRKKAFKVGPDDEIANPFILTPPNGSAGEADYRYHLWTVRSSPEAECEGIANFWTMPSAGFARYVGFLDWSRDPSPLPALIASVEERMVRDSVRSGLQMIRDGEQMQRRGKRKGSIGKTMVSEGAKMVEDGNAKKEEDERKGRDGRGTRGWYLECDESDREQFVKAGFRDLGIEYMQRGEPGRRVHLMFKRFGRANEKDEPTQIPEEVRVQTGLGIRKSSNRTAEVKATPASKEVGS